MEDLTIVFNNPKALFKQDSSVITNDYKNILDEFIPIYIGIINKEKYKNSIKEVIIGGHTANKSNKYSTYIDTIELSQDRAREILKYIMTNSSYDKINDLDKDKLKFWFTANGYGLGRAVDSSGDFVHKTNKDISPKSRRVEFRIVTNSEQIIDEIFKSIN